MDRRFREGEAFRSWRKVTQFVRPFWLRWPSVLRHCLTTHSFNTRNDRLLEITPKLLTVTSQHLTQPLMLLPRALQWLGGKSGNFSALPGFTRRPSGLAAIQALPAPRTDPARPGYPSIVHATLRHAENR